MFLLDISVRISVRSLIYVIGDKRESPPHDYRCASNLVEPHKSLVPAF